MPIIQMTTYKIGTPGPTPPGPWTPGANTIAYYPLTSATTVNDMSGNNKTLTAYGTIQYTDTYAHFSANASGQSYFYRGDIGFSLGQQFYYGIRVYKDIQETGNARIIAPPNRGFIIGTIQANVGVDFGEENLGAESISLRNIPNFFQKWIYLYYTGTVGGSVKGGIIYPSGEEYSGTGPGNALSSGMYIGTNGNNTYRHGDGLRGYVSNLIVENKVRTAQEISDYYDQTKGDYGIS